MALAQGINWEIRSTGTSLNAGAGFNPSNAAGNTVDYSQQDSPQYTFTDLATTTGTSANPSVTSASHSFVTADVGNIIRISAGAGWTPQWYEIQSVAAGAATLDRACAATATATAGTYFVGGALPSLTGNWLTSSNSFPGGAIIWIKGNISQTSGFNPSGGGNNTIEGYLTTRGDMPQGNSRPLIDVGANSFACTSSSNFRHLRFTGTGTGTVTTPQTSVMWNCKATNSSTTAGRAAWQTTINQGCHVVSCEGISYRGNGVVAGNQVFIIGSYMHDCDVGILYSAGSGAIVDNLVESCKTAAIQLSGPQVQIHSNTLVGGVTQKTGIGISITSTATLTMTSNIFYGFATAYNMTSTTKPIGFNNLFFNNTTNTNGNYIGNNDQTIIDPAFINVRQVTGATATTSGNVLTQAAANFSNVIDNQDFCLILSGTGVTVGQYLITSHTTTTLTLDIAPGTSAVADKSFQVTTGRNFAVGPAVIGKGFPNLFPAGLTHGFPNCGAVMRMDVSSYSRGRTVNAGP